MLLLLCIVLLTGCPVKSQLGVNEAEESTVMPQQQTEEKLDGSHGNMEITTLSFVDSSERKINAQYLSNIIYKGCINESQLNDTLIFVNLTQIFQIGNGKMGSSEIEACFSMCFRRYSDVKAVSIKNPTKFSVHGCGCSPNVDHLLNIKVDSESCLSTDGYVSVYCGAHHQKCLISNSPSLTNSIYFHLLIGFITVYLKLIV